MANPEKHLIPFNKASIVPEQLSYVSEAFERGHISGDGEFTKRCHKFLESTLNVEKALLTTSCTHALEMAALLLNIKPGDEVIAPAFTFVSTVNAFVLRGAVPVFVDIRMDTLNMEEDRIEDAVTDKTRVIIPVHYAGVGCEMDRIMQIAKHCGAAVVEDNAHGLFGKYKGRYLGTFGTFATQSFHETKNFTCGEGGCLLINDGSYIERAEIIREKGTNRSRFFRGEVDKYTWVDEGSSYLPSEINAAVLHAQFQNYQKIQARRKFIWDFYFSGLQDWAHSEGVVLPTIPPHCDQAYHMFYMLMPEAEIQSRFIGYMKSKGIMVVFHYLPLNASPMGQKTARLVMECPNTESASRRVVRLPFFSDLKQSELDYIVQSIREFKC